MSDIQIESFVRVEYSGRVRKGEGCFSDVMREFPYETLWELLNHPRPIDLATLSNVITWCRPKVVQGTTFAEAVLDCGLLKTKSEVYRKVKEGAMKWNGQRVTDPHMPIRFQFLEPGWAVIQLGKLTHRVLLDRGWRYADPDDYRNPRPQTNP